MVAQIPNIFFVFCLQFCLSFSSQCSSIILVVHSLLFSTRLLFLSKSVQKKVLSLLSSPLVRHCPKIVRTIYSLIGESDNPLFTEVLSSLFSGQIKIGEKKPFSANKREFICQVSVCGCIKIMYHNSMCDSRKYFPHSSTMKLKIFVSLELKV